MTGQKQTNNKKLGLGGMRLRSLKNTIVKFTGGAYCRIWALNGVAVHKSFVRTGCDNDTLTYQTQNNILGKFQGDGPAQALCCNWTLCNYNITFAMLSEEPSSAMPSLQNLSLNLGAIVYIVLFTQIVRYFV